MRLEDTAIQWWNGNQRTTYLTRQFKKLAHGNIFLEGISTVDHAMEFCEKFHSLKQRRLSWLILTLNAKLFSFSLLFSPEILLQVSFLKFLRSFFLLNFCLKFINEYKVRNV